MGCLWEPLAALSSCLKFDRAFLSLRVPKRARKLRLSDVEDVDEGIEQRNVRCEVEQNALSPDFMSGPTSTRTSVFSDTTSHSAEA
jgi:hypothetical protein